MVKRRKRISRKRSMTEIKNRIGCHNFDTYVVRDITGFYKGKTSNPVRGGESWQSLVNVRIKVLSKLWWFIQSKIHLWILALYQNHEKFEYTFAIGKKLRLTKTNSYLPNLWFWLNHNSLQYWSANRKFFGLPRVHKNSNYLKLAFFTDKLEIQQDSEVLKSMRYRSDTTSCQFNSNFRNYPNILGYPNMKRKWKSVLLNYSAQPDFKDRINYH